MSIPKVKLFPADDANRNCLISRKKKTVQKHQIRRPTPTLDAFRDDPLFPRIERAVTALLLKGKVVAPVDVLVAMDLLTPAHL
jgi:hypothetical protein